VIMKAIVKFIGLLLLISACKNSPQIDHISIGADRFITIDIEKGARITSFTLGDYEAIVSELDNPNYYGSTAWPAPQSDWDWPPPQALDALAYTRNAKKENLYHSAVDSALQISMTKEIKLLPEDRVEITYGIKNKGSTSYQVGAWEVTRVNTGISFFPVDSLMVMEESNLPGIEIEKNVAWCTYSEELHPVGGKKYFESGKEGWLAHLNDNVLFLKTYDDISPHQVPPSHGEIEIYTQADKPSYTELEIHGPYVSLEPGHSCTMTVRWKLYEVPTNIRTLDREELLTWVRNLVIKQKG